ncbi:MAG: hypothetical protein U5K79_06835 [Cyclobacteriaceae bacterium]|nr:hypothetical protein [Cyclobacteriaceae bacterium]
MLTSPAELERVRQQREKFIQENLQELESGSTEAERNQEKPVTDEEAVAKPENQ